LSDDHIHLYLCAEFTDIIHFPLDNGLRKTKFRDAIDQNAAGFVKRFKNRHIVAFLGKFAGNRKTGRSRADNGHLLPGRFGRFRHSDIAMVGFIIGGETFQSSNGHRFAFLAQNTFCLALRFLRADAAAYGRERIRVFDCMDGAHKIAVRHLLNEGRDGNVHGASFHAGHFLALQATGGFPDRILPRIAERNLVEVLNPLFRILFRHSFAPFRFLLQLFRLEFQLALMVPQRPPFFAVIHFLAVDQFLEVHLMAVKFRPVHADEFRFPRDGRAAAAAHTGSIHHDGVQADDRADIVGPGDVRYGTHHDHRTDADNFINLLPFFNELFQNVGNKAVVAIATIVGCDI